jgi:hypothetical protein
MTPTPPPVPPGFTTSNKIAISVTAVPSGDQTVVTIIIARRQ